MKQNPTTKPSNSPKGGLTSNSVSGLTAEGGLTKGGLSAQRSICEIIVHCTATKAGRPFAIEDIRRWHIQRGFRDIGYHYLVLLNGTIQPGRPLAEVGAHCAGHNANSIGVCYVGGLSAKGTPADTRTPEQRQALRLLLTNLCRQFPAAVIRGHRDFAAKSCPCFDATTEYANL